MSITKEHAEQFKNSPAVLCCRRTKGTVISSEDLEDPSIFPDMIESGLINVTEKTLSIGDVIGATLIEDAEGLTALSEDILEGVKKSQPKLEDKKESGGKRMTTVNQNSGVIHLEIDQLSGLKLDLPAGAFGGIVQTSSMQEEEVVDEVVGTLIEREFAVKEVKLGQVTSFENGVLTIREQLCKDALKADPLVKKLEMDIINPDNRHVYSNTIMDVIPVAAKVEGDLGSGVTHILNDMVFVLTGVD